VVKTRQQELDGVIEQGNAIESMLKTDGWKMIEAEFRQRLDSKKTNKELRKANRDSVFYLLRGRLDGIEEVIERPKRYLDLQRQALEEKEGGR